VEKRRGLRSLIPTGMIERPEGAEEVSPGAPVTEVPVDRIRRSLNQPRQEMPEEGMAELMESIRMHGILQPVVVRRVDRGEYELVAGERRYQAARRLGLKMVPAVVREADDQGALEMALVENLQREDINPMEAAVAYRRLILQFGLKQEQVAERVGKSRAGVGNTLRLLSLPEEVQESVRKGEISEGHGKALAALEDPRLAVKVWRLVLKGDLSVQQTQTAVNVIVKRIVPRGTKLGEPKSPAPKDPNVEAMESELTRKLSTRVRLVTRRKGGYLQIAYADWDDLDRIVGALTAGGRR